jgi:hypothetical protein
VPSGAADRVETISPCSWPDTLPKGIGSLAGVGDDPVVVRGYYLDRVAADRIADRAQAIRERAGTLTGYCIGEDDGPRAGRNARSAPLWP